MGVDRVANANHRDYAGPQRRQLDSHPNDRIERRRARARHCERWPAEGGGGGGRHRPSCQHLLTRGAQPPAEASLCRTQPPLPPAPSAERSTAMGVSVARRRRRRRPAPCGTRPPDHPPAGRTLAVEWLWSPTWPPTPSPNLAATSARRRTMPLWQTQGRRRSPRQGQWGSRGAPGAAR